MKDIIKIIMYFAISITCNAQLQVIDILDDNGDEITGAYYKDTQNLLNPFEGTYLYTNGNTSLKIQLRKKIMSSMNNFYYEDLIVGDYQFIKEGEEIANCLNAIYETNITIPNGCSFPISGNLIITQGDPDCQHCIAGEKALYVGFSDDITDNWASVSIRLITVSGQPAIEMHVFWEGPKIWHEGTPRPLNAIFPGGYYTLIKQL
jgi:hypothetical protein